MQTDTKVFLGIGAVVVGIYAVKKFYDSGGKGIGDITSGAGQVAGGIGQASQSSGQFVGDILNPISAFWKQSFDYLGQAQTGLFNLFNPNPTSMQTQSTLNPTKMTNIGQSTTYYNYQGYQPQSGSVKAVVVGDNLLIEKGATYNTVSGVYVSPSGQGYSVAPKNLFDFNKQQSGTTAKTGDVLGQYKNYATNITQTNSALKSYVKSTTPYSGGLSAREYTKKMFGI